MHAAPAGRGERRQPLRRADRGRQRSTSSSMWRSSGTVCDGSREIVAVPGRAEGDVIEIADIFVTGRGGSGRADGFPPHREPSARGLRRCRAPGPGGCMPRLSARAGARCRGLLHLVVVLADRLPARAARARRFSAGLRDQLAQAGYASISPSNVVVGSVVLFVVHVRPLRGPHAGRADRAVLRCHGRLRLRSRWCVCVLGVVGPSCVTCGPMSSTTSPPVSAPGWPCPRRCRSSPSVVRRSCALRSRRFARGLPSDGSVPRLPRPAQGPTQRPGRRPDRRVAADRPRGGRQ